jgi:hypothetical protein
MQQSTFISYLASAIREFDQRISGIIPLLQGSCWPFTTQLESRVNLDLTQYLIDVTMNKGPVAERLRENARIDSLIAKCSNQTAASTNAVLNTENVIQELSPKRHRYDGRRLQEILLPYVPLFTDHYLNYIVPQVGHDWPRYDTIPEGYPSRASDPSMVEASQMRSGLWFYDESSSNRTLPPTSPCFYGWRYAFVHREVGGSVVNGVINGSFAGFYQSDLVIYNALENDYYTTTIREFIPLEHIEQDLRAQMLELGWKEEVYREQCWSTERKIEAMEKTFSAAPVLDLTPFRSTKTSWNNYPATSILHEDNYPKDVFDGYRGSGYIEWVTVPREEGEQPVRKFRASLNLREGFSSNVTIEGCLDTGELHVLDTHMHPTQIIVTAPSYPYILRKVAEKRDYYLEYTLPRWFHDNERYIQEELLQQLPLELLARIQQISDWDVD